MKIKILFALILSLSLSGCFKKEGEQSNQTIKIAVVSPYSGDLASYGIPAKNAAKLAVNTINAQGGVLGKQIELMEEDDVCEANTAVSVANKVISENVSAVVGHLCSGATKAALPLYKEAKIVVISPASTNPELTLDGEFPNFFRTIAHDAAQATLQVDFAIDQLKAKKVVVIHDKGDYGKGLADLVKQKLEKAHVEVALYEGITPGAVDYSAVVTKIKQAEPDTIIFGGYHPEASKIVTQMKQKGMTVNFISGDGVKDPAFIKIAGENAEGSYASAPSDPSQIPMAQSVAEIYKTQYQTDYGTFSLQAYAAIQSIVRAIEKTGGVDYQKLLKALQTETVNTPLGNISFDPKGDIVGAGFAMYRVDGGSFKKSRVKVSG